MSLLLVPLVFLVSTVTSSSVDLNTTDCGIKPDPKISNGSATIADEYPWNIALYREYGDSKEPRYICVGNIIHPRVVLTSAVCVYNEEEYAVENSTFMVAAGKFNRSWEHRDSREQRRQVTKIYIPPTYAGFRNRYGDDIALLALNESFVTGTSVLPVCLDWNRELDTLLQSTNGTVVGWVKDENSTLTSELHVETLKYHSFRECLKEVQEGFATYLTSDKFCAGTDDFAGIISGGGLTYARNTTAGKQQHYLFGLASLKDHDRQELGVFTDVRKHLPWLNETLSKIKIK